MKKLIVLMVMMLTVLVAGESATAYEKGKSYTAGDRVYSSGHVYVCKVAGWCSQTAYEPALSLHWRNAWEDRGEGTLEGEAPSHNQTAAWKANHHYSSGDTIRYQEKTYICKGYPYTPWCSQRAPGTNGWREAWEEHEAQVTQDTIPPVITLHGEATMTLEQNVVYTELGATALDDVDGNVSVTISGTVNTAVVGTYTLTYMAQDSAGNEANITRTITVIDVTPPVITLNGESTITLEQHAVYTELGATALDGVDGNVSVTISGNVDTSTVGSYTVTYSVTDSAGNEANTTRTITVIDVTPPVLTLNGEASVTLEQNAVYTELGATALDVVDGNVTVTTTGNVDTATVGNYTVTYSATDTAGNEANITRSITVIDVTPPVITLNGEANITLEQNAVYTELGATAVDAVDGNVTVTTTGNVDTSTIGNYIVTYSATDSAGNEANITRSVEVINSTPTLSSITLESNATTVNVGDMVQLSVVGTYSDGSSNAVDENITYTITPNDSVEMNGSVLIAKKDGNVTVQAKVGTTLSNKVTLTITWVVNGHVLPPEPDPAVNNATLLGVDVNDNGVRDDVERWIYETYDHPIERGIFMQSSRAYNKVIVDPDRAKETKKYADNVVSCSAYWIFIHKPIPFNKYDFYDHKIELRKVQFNNMSRHIAYTRYEGKLSGGVYPALQELKEKCEFDEYGILGDLNE